MLFLLSSKVLAECDLVTDLNTLTHGIDEEVGERGTTLSGGQQARLNLARALFRDPRLLVVDDVLAAVDAKVALILFQTIQAFVTAAPSRRAMRPRRSSATAFQSPLTRLRLLQSKNGTL